MPYRQPDLEAQQAHDAERQLHAQEARDHRAVWEDGEDEEKYALARSILGAVRARLGGEVRTAADDDEIFELRFTHQGRPTRIILDATFSGEIEIEAKFVNRRGVVMLDWDQELTNVPADPVPRASGSGVLDPWAAEDAESRKFHLGGGVYIGGFGGQAAGMLDLLDGLAEGERAALVEGVADLRLGHFYLEHDGASLELSDELADLNAYIHDRLDATLDLLARSMTLFEQV